MRDLSIETTSKNPHETTHGATSDMCVVPLRKGVPRVSTEHGEAKGERLYSEAPQYGEGE